MKIPPDSTSIGCKVVHNDTFRPFFVQFDVVCHINFFSCTSYEPDKLIDT